MASQSTNELNDQKTADETEESNNEDSIQRKRSRIGSHPEEESNHKFNHEKTNEILTEASSTTIENQETPAINETKTTTATIKRRKLNVETGEPLDHGEQTNDSAHSMTVSSTDDGSKDESSTTTDDEDDDDVDDNHEEEEDEEDDEKDDGTNENNKFPPTTNIYLRLRQRELGIYHRPRERTTIRAFHNNMIASRNLVQRMKVSHTLDGHNGCVNALAFNRTGKNQSSLISILNLFYILLGTLLASASDDLQIILWDWASNQAAAAYESHHHSNVFQVNIYKLKIFPLMLISLGKIYSFF